MTGSRQRTGKLGERLASEKLVASGYEILEQNYRCTAGEVDIVARDGGCYAFVEVRARRGRTCGSPEESVTPAKQRRLIEVAESYLEERGLREVDWRIDVVAVEWTRAGRLERVEIIRDAVSG
jgi:putative endonuclease